MGSEAYLQRHERILGSHDALHDDLLTNADAKTHVA
jgi:hypothetical protein